MFFLKKKAKEEHLPISSAIEIKAKKQGLNSFILLHLTGPGVKDASCRPSSETDCCSCAQTSLDCPLGPTATVSTKQTGCTTSSKGEHFMVSVFYVFQLTLREPLSMPPAPFPFSLHPVLVWNSLIWVT
jgi:hypothetical protein